MYSRGLFEVACRTCRHRFGIPFMSEFEWGEFIFHGNRGGLFVYFNSYAGTIWKEIEKVRPKEATSDLFQEIVARCADPVAGQSFTLLPVCPACRSKDIEQSLERPLPSQKFPKATFKAFLALSAKEKTERLRELARRLSPR